jgi:hypothetical protein
VYTADSTDPQIAAALHFAQLEGFLYVTEVSRRTGIDTGDLSRLDNGKVPDPRTSTLTRYARALGKRLAWSLESG